MGKKLLREYYALCDGGICQDLLTEDEKRYVANGGMILSGIMQMTETQNGNGRVYQHGTMQREVKNYQKLVKERRALGELDHPDDSVINLRNASHMVTEIWMEGKNVMGKIKVLDTPSGKILQELVNGGVTVGVSSRGMGSVSESNGRTIVEDDFQLICFDMVSEPSTPGAFMMKEAKDLTNLPNNKLFTLNKNNIFSICFNFPKFILNPITVKLFNIIIYFRAKYSKKELIVDWDKFFYPLDKILGWNKIYGKRGFIQFQCVIPLDNAKEGLTEILKKTYSKVN